MNQERGLTLIGLLFLLALAASAAMVGFRIMPAYIDYFTVKHTLENILIAGSDQTDSDLRKTLDARLNVNFIQDISARDLVIERDKGVLTLTVPINRKEHLVGGVSVCVDLEAMASTRIKE